MTSSFLMFLDHTQRRSTVGRTILDEWSARRRDLYLTTHDTHNRQTSMPPVGFEPTILAGERPLGSAYIYIYIYIYIYSYMLFHNLSTCPNTRRHIPEDHNISVNICCDISFVRDWLVEQNISMKQQTNRYYKNRYPMWHKINKLSKSSESFVKTYQEAWGRGGHSICQWGWLPSRVRLLFGQIKLTAVSKVTYWAMWCLRDSLEQVWAIYTVADNPARQLLSGYSTVHEFQKSGVNLTKNGLEIFSFSQWMTYRSFWAIRLCPLVFGSRGYIIK